MRKNQGITLVALIITIIIMLILVAVSVNVIIKSNLIGTAEKAANEYKTAYERENQGNIEIDGKKYDSIDDYLYGAPPKLKYEVEGRKIDIWLENSEYDYYEKQGKSNEEEFTQLIEHNIGMTMEELSEIASKATSEEEILELITVNVTTPNEENIKLLWLKDGNVPEGCANVYSYIVEQSGNYTFKATNRRGRTSEITVPVETATFTLQLSETETKTFTFIEGDTWEGFIGNEGTITIDGVQFTRNSNSSIDIDCASLIKYSPSERFTLYMQDGNAVVQTDKIVTNGSYIVKRRGLM